MSRTRTVLALTAVATLLSVAACGGSGADPLATASPGGSTAAKGTIIVGGANFPESNLLAEIYAGALEAKGLTVVRKLNIGSRETYVPALADGSINLIPEYTGSIDHYFKKDAKAVGADAVYAELKAALPSNLTVLDQSAAENKDSVAVTKETATKDNLKAIGDLASVAKDFVFGGAPEFKTRESSGIPALKRIYGLTFKDYRPFDAGGKATADALANDQVQAANLYTTDPWLRDGKLVVLEDPKGLFGSQNVVPLIAKSAVTPAVTEALNAVSAKLDTTSLIAMNDEVFTDKKDAKVVAAEFLKKNGLGG